MVEVNYTLYEQGSSLVLSEGAITINVNTPYEAEKTVRAMFARPGTELNIQFCRMI